MLYLPQNDLLACPNCQATESAGLNVQLQRCDACDTQFFDLSGMPCWFSTGIEQKKLWESLFALAIERGYANLNRAEDATPKVMSSRTRERVATIHAANREIINDIDNLLSDIGLQKHIHPGFEQYDAGRMLQYFELLLRDWAWDRHTDDAGSSSKENTAELLRVEHAIKASGKSLGRTWVVGAGAGRLSWDIHSCLDSEMTIAMDTNPVLVSAAQRILKLNQAWELTELHPNPQKGKSLSQRWLLDRTVCGDSNSFKKLNSWYVMGGNVFTPPFKPASFDTIVTPWFIDVNGKDIREVIALIRQYLKPGGLWVNTGPLLYGSDIPQVQRYSHAEIREFAELAGFRFDSDEIQTAHYLNTPLADDCRSEQVWTFSARYTADLNTSASCSDNLPAWVLLPHLPIPKGNFNTQGNVVLEQLVSRVDGKTSISDIAQSMRPNLPEDVDPMDIIMSAFVDIILR